METFYGKGSHFFNCGPVGEPQVEKKHSGIPNGIKHFAIFVVYRQITNMVMCLLIRPGLPQVGDF